VLFTAAASASRLVAEVFLFTLADDYAAFFVALVILTTEKIAC
jgi:hypothetical protein